MKVGKKKKEKKMNRKQPPLSAERGGGEAFLILRTGELRIQLLGSKVYRGLVLGCSGDGFLQALLGISAILDHGLYMYISGET